MSETKSNEGYNKGRSPFKVTFRDREKGEESPNYYQSVLLKNSLEAVKKAGIEITPKLIENLGQVAFKIGGIAGDKENLSLVDPLTGLCNRRFFEEAAKDKMSESKRHSLPLIFGYIDLNNFKVFNDELGHSAGDKFLQIFGNLLTSNLREEDICARIGGDEFVFIMVGTSLKNAQKVMKRLTKEIKFLTDEQYRNLSKPFGFSFGFEQWDGESSIRKMMKRADKKLYQMKRADKKLYREKKEKHG